MIGLRAQRSGMQRKLSSPLCMPARKPPHMMHASEGAADVRCLPLDICDLSAVIYLYRTIPSLPPASLAFAALSRKRRKGSSPCATASVQHCCHPGQALKARVSIVLRSRSAKERGLASTAGSHNSSPARCCSYPPGRRAAQQFMLLSVCKAASVTAQAMLAQRLSNQSQGCLRRFCSSTDAVNVRCTSGRVCLTSGPPGGGDGPGGGGCILLAAGAQHPQDEDPGLAAALASGKGTAMLPSSHVSGCPLWQPFV